MKLIRLPLLWPATGWAAGLFLARSDTPGFELSLILIAIIVLGLLIAPLRAFLAFALGGIIWGVAALLWSASVVSVSPEWLEAPVSMTGKIVEVRDSQRYTRVTLNAVRNDDGEALSGRVQIYFYGKQRQAFEVGDQVSGAAKLRTPENMRNPGAFDYRAYCFDRGIALIGSARQGWRIEVRNGSWLDVFRQRIRTGLSVTGEESRGILSALLLAERYTIPPEVESWFSASGAAHLLAISGLHVGMVALWAFLLCWWILTRREAWIVNFPVRKLSILAGVLAAFTYATVAGWPLPTQRAWLMLLAALIAWQLRARNAPLNTMLAALMLILLLDPAAAVSISLWLSFAAATALLLWTSGREGESKTARRWLAYPASLFAVSLVAMLATLPLIAATFGRLPVYGLIANLLLVPWYSLLVLPLAIAGEIAAIFSLGPAQWLWSLAGNLIALGNDFLAILYQWPYGNLWLIGHSLWIEAGYFAGLAALAFFWLRGEKLVTGLILPLLLILYAGLVIPERQLAQPLFTVWDAGQGAASTLQMPDGFVLEVDVPGYEESRFGGGAMVAAGLRALGQTHVDVLALTHAQSDHMGGAMLLLHQINSIGELWLADVAENRSDRRLVRIIDLVQQKGGEVRWLRQGDAASFGEAGLRVLWPPKGAEDNNPNHTSLVLSLRVNGRTLLLPGDIDAEAERAITRAGIGHHDLMLMPHHGSRTSSSIDLLQAVRPGYVIAQTGRNNRFGFPKPDIVARYEAVGASVLNSADGAVQLVIPPAPGESLQIQLWQAPAASKRERALQWWQSTL